MWAFYQFRQHWLTVNDSNTPPFSIQLFSEARCVEVNENRPTLSEQKDSTESADFSNVQIVHKFGG